MPVRTLEKRLRTRWQSPLVWAREDTLTMRGESAFSSSSMSKVVSRNGPRWFTVMCSSYPSSPFAQTEFPIMPALFSRMSSLEYDS
jgi:hypothetical protein